MCTGRQEGRETLTCPAVNRRSSSSRQSVIKYRLSSAANRAHAGELIGRATVLSVSFSFSPIFSHPSSPFFNLPLFLLLLLLCISASEIFFSQFFFAAASNPQNKLLSLSSLSLPPSPLLSLSLSLSESFFSFLLPYFFVARLVVIVIW